MTSNSRSVNTSKNVIFGFFFQICVLLLSFIGRSVFIRFLGVEYLGIGGLYSNILTVLSLTELGLGNVILFSLYKPVAEGDEQTVAALLRYYKKLYNYIAIAVACVGLILIPFLKYIINSELAQKDLILYYLIFLLNSMCSYFAAHKKAEITAHQELYLIKRINVISSLIINVLQIIVLVLFRNYYIYLLLSVLSTLISNLLITRTANKRYTHPAEMSGSIDLHKPEIIENVKSTFVYKIGITITTYTDNILISAMIGTVWVGYYSNYQMVVLSVQAYLGIIITALIPSIGNLNAENNPQKSKDKFFVLLLFFHWITAFAAISFYQLFDDLIPLWLGSEYLLDPLTLFAICLNFYIGNIINPVWMFREAMGLFRKIKFLMLTTAILNIIFSIILGKIIGIAGILLATALSRLLTEVWYEPKILFTKKLGLGQSKYWKQQAKYLLLTAISGISCYCISVIFSNTLISMVIKCVLYFIITSIVFAVASLKSEEFSQLVAFVRDMFKYLFSKLSKKGE